MWPFFEQLSLSPVSLRCVRLPGLALDIQLCPVFHQCVSEKGWHRRVEVEYLEASSYAARDTLHHLLHLPVLLILPCPSDNPSRLPRTDKTHTDKTHVHATSGHCPGTYQPGRLMLMCLLGVCAPSVPPPSRKVPLNPPGMLSVSKRGHRSARACVHTVCVRCQINPHHL